jgi:predicted metal-dependent HD superfamily phosphohydrolase
MNIPNKLSLGTFRDPEVERSAAKLYSATLPYHNFTHALAAVTEGMGIVLLCASRGIRIDPQVVYYALLFHDAGYHENHIEKGFESKESYSAHLAATTLKKHRVRHQVIQKVEQAIRGTAALADVITAEQRVVRAADLSGLASDYTDFRANTERLKREHEILTGKSIPWSDWVERTISTISSYLRHGFDFEVLHAGHNEPIGFCQKAYANLRRLAEEH